MHVHVFVVVHIHICVHVYGDQRSISDLISQELSTLYFWRQSLLLTWDSLFRRAWLTSKPPDSSAYTSSELGCVSTHQHAWSSGWVLEMECRPFYLYPLPQSVSVGKTLLIQWLVLHWTPDRQRMEPVFGFVVPLLVLT